ncbi:MAG TPA: hypothetical protein VHO50_07080 [Bacteroidales bacterium]|nr:hypothetical protein [Bacteroidales bacterium]
MEAKIIHLNQCPTSRQLVKQGISSHQAALKKWQRRLKDLKNEKRSSVISEACSEAINFHNKQLSFWQECGMKWDYLELGIHVIKSK